MWLRVGWVSVVVLLVAYAAVLLWFRANENFLLFAPVKGALEPPPAALSLPFRDVSLHGVDGLELSARVIPPPTVDGVPRSNPGWLLYFHGASGNVGTPGYNEAWARFHQLGFGVMAVDYPGYGRSAGEPTEAGCYRAADAAHAYLKRDLAVPEDRILIYGYSLGSAVAIDLATRVRARGLIVEGALLSVPIRGAELYPWLPVSWLARNQFASVDKIARVELPKLFVHARHDEAVPIAHGRRLFELAQEPRQFAMVQGGHADAYQVDPAFFKTVSQFASSLELP